MPDWNELFQEKVNRWEDPYEAVIALTDSGELSTNAKVLDLGCGAGRHLRFLENRGYKAVGLDIAPNGLKSAKDRLIENRLDAQLIQADMSVPLPFPAASFDCVISIHVIFHNSRKVIVETNAEIKRVLKPGGVFLVTFNSVYSSRCGKGFQLEEFTWLPDIGIDKGIPHHFSTLQDVADLMVGFKVQGLHLEENITDGAVSSHWVITAKKEEHRRSL